MKLRTLPVVLLLLFAPAFVACSSSSPTGPRTPEDVTFNPALGIDLAEFDRLPSGVYIKTDVEGDGPAVAAGNQVTVNYELRLVDNSLLEASPPSLSFVLDDGRVIPGFDIGVTGMRLGEQRRIIIPSNLAYGAGGQGAIPPNAVLIFDVTLIAFG